MNSGFKDLQSIISCGSAGKSTFNRPVKTKTDSIFEAAQHLLLTALRLLSATTVLEEYIKEIPSDQSSRSLINRKTQHTVLESFEDFIEVMDEKGHIDEEQYNIRGIRMDKDINRQDVFRTAGIAQESFQCSKCLTHFHQVNMRLEQLQIIKSKETEKKATANMKHDELIQANKKVIEVICTKLLRDGIIDEGAEFCKEHMKLCSMKMLSELTNPQLEAFILARDTSVIKS